MCACTRDSTAHVLESFMCVHVCICVCVCLCVCVCAPDSAAHILVCFADAAGHVPQLSRREGSTEVSGSISHEHLEIAPFRILQYSLVGSNVAAVDEVGVLWFPVACADNLGAMTEDKICGLHGARTNINRGQKALVRSLPAPR